MQKKLKGYKDRASRMQAEDVGMQPDPNSTAEPHVQGNFFFHFLGLVKFPTLTELENCQRPYPFIPAYVLQTMALHQCSVPPEEATLELLEAPKDAEAEAGGKDGGSKDKKMMVIND